MTVIRRNYRDGLFLIGLAAVVSGCVLVAVPLGLIVGGIAFLALPFMIGGK